ncbi:hypothetical protein BCR35DRAFT_298467 [Leucosporidium creatinivorum]|uniref:Uncharacterized protein n=1 Tax=Leucosporidium creatinivorum TaxID=106004 RepID=A0A1Y2G742_9BASI|nr:hypothetical protein BCR35DRAFT_298467 [Leucosporidium creatinivorum]
MSAQAQHPTSLGATPQAAVVAELPALEVSMQVKVNFNPQLYEALIDTTLPFSSVSLSLLHQLGLIAYATPLQLGFFAAVRPNSGVQIVTDKITLLISTETSILGCHEFLVNSLWTATTAPFILGADFARAFQLRVNEEGTRVFFQVAHGFLAPSSGATGVNDEAARRRQAIIEWVKECNQHASKGPTPAVNAVAPAASQHGITQGNVHTDPSVAERWTVKKRQSRRRSSLHHSIKQTIRIYESTSAHGTKQRVVVLKEKVKRAERGVRSA